MRIRVNREVEIGQSTSTKSITKSLTLKESDKNTAFTVFSTSDLPIEVMLPKIPKNKTLVFTFVIDKIVGPFRILTPGLIEINGDPKGVQLDSDGDAITVTGIGSNYYVEEIMLKNISNVAKTGKEIKDWEVISPLNNDHIDLANTLGLRVSGATHGASIRNSGSLSYDPDGGRWLSNYYGRVVKLDDKLHIADTPPIAYQVPASGDGVAYNYDMNLSEELIAVPSYGHNCVKVYYRSTGELKCVIGVPGSAGAHSDGKVNRPYSALILPNGTVAVSSYTGYLNTGDLARGTISVWDIENTTDQVVGTYGYKAATFLDVKMEHKETNIISTGDNSIYSPMRMIFDREDSNFIWISNYGAGIITKVDITEWKNVKTFTTPPGAESIKSSYGIDQLDDGTIIVGSNTSGYLTGIDPEDGSLRFSYNLRDFGIRKGEIIAVSRFKGDTIAIGSSKETGLVFVQPFPIEIPYEEPNVPVGWKLREEFLPEVLDTEDWVVRVDAAKIKPLSMPITIIKEII